MKRLIVAVVATGLFATATAASAIEWPQLGFDAAGSGTNNEEAQISTETADRWRVRWQRHPDEHRTYTTAPAVSEDAVYVGGIKIGKDGRPHSQVWSYALEGGHQLWARQLPCVGAKGPGLGLANGMVLATLNCWEAHDYDQVAMLDATSGRKLGAVSIEGPIQVGPTIVGDTAVYEDGQTNLTIIDLNSRTIADTQGFSENFTGYTSPLPVVDGVAWLTDGFGSSLLAQDVVVIDGSATYSKPLGTTGKVQFFKCPAPPALCALSSDTDETVNDEAIWSKSLASGDGGEYLGPPIVLGDVVYTAGNGVMHAFDLHTGHVVWETVVPQLDGEGIYLGDRRPIAANGVIFVRGYDSVRADAVIIGFDAATGELVTRRPGTQRLGPLGGTFMAIANGRLVTSVPSIRVSLFDRV